MTEIVTARLRMRRWRADDLDAFASINADPIVMQCFPSPLTRQQTEALIDELEQHFDRHGYSQWALEVKNTGELIGFTGLTDVGGQLPFAPATEVAWRLAANAWGRGYAYEAARAAIDFGWGTAGLTEIVSFTAKPNHRSERLMQRLAMTHDPADDFDHPKLPVADRLRPHVLYRIRRES